ncbi:MAG: DUF342 domain-containing protein [Chitinivibrionales bacterium]|nr:DUF342 domain-containing protein [Chitinivibrionales bacterium]MBD3396366.1 DUF342 domain-containing protein [Chitinivibrionales bacterium]
MATDIQSATIRCIVDKQAMSVTLYMERECGSERPVSVNDVLNELRISGVTYGVDTDAVEAAVRDYNEQHCRIEAIVARGKKPVDGKDGELQCLMASPHANLRVKEDGTVDFKNIDTIPRVRENQPVYRRTGVTPGETGMDVCGRKIPPKPANPVAFPQIEFTAVDQEDPDTLVSTIEGCAVFDRDVLKLSKCYYVTGDVDYSTGNIRYNGSVKILGDVKAGFEVGAVGNIEIDGTVEDAIVKSGGDITVKCGFVGAGKGLIWAKGDVRIGYVRNQRVFSQRSIYVGKEAIECRLHAHRKIHVIGQGLGLAGGTAFAVEGMELSALGTEAEVKTRVNLGSPPETREKLEDIGEKLDTLKKKSAQCDASLAEIENAKKKSRNLFDKLIEKMEQVMEEKMGYDMESEALRKEKAQIEKNSPMCKDPRLKISGTVYPGVVMDFLGFRRVIEKATHNSVFFLEKGEIRESTLRS